MTNTNPIFPKTLAGFFKRNFFRYHGASWMLWSALWLTNSILFRTFPPIYTKWFIEILEKYGKSPDAFTTKFVVFAITVISILTATQIIFTFSSRLRDKLIPRSADLVSRDLYKYVYNQTISFYTRTMPGKISNQISLISGFFRSTYTDIFGTLLAIIVVFILNMGLIFQINQSVAAVLLLGIVLRVSWAIYRHHPFAMAIRRSSETQSVLNGKLLDGLSNFTIVKLFAGAAKEESSIDTTRRRQIDDMDKSRFQYRIFIVTPWYFDSFFVTLVMFFTAMAFAGGSIGIADAMFILAAYTMLSNIVWDFVYSLPNVLDSYNMAVEAYEKLIAPIEVTDTENAKPIQVTKGAIEIKNLSFSYGRHKVLDNLCISIQPGEKVGLVGVSGAGKTTLMNMIMRLHDPASGAILIDGQDLRDVTQDSLRENISFIPQDPTMFNRTLLENIAYGDPKRAIKDIKNAAKRASADKFINDTPHKYNTLVGDRGIKLSGGQRQRIAIARAFLKNAPILILDEATSALDSETEAVVQKSLAELSSGRTTIAIAHRLSTLRQMDRLIVMDKGKVIESGTHKTLVKKRGGIYARLWAMQSGGFIQE